jgi:mannosyltransferase
VLSQGSEQRLRLSRNDAVSLAVLLTIGATLRFATLGLQSFWFDEAVTTTLLRMDPLRMLRVIAQTESTPPLYYLVAWPWARAFGTGEVALRSLSAFAGAAVVAPVYLSARRLGGSSAALFAGALTAVNPLLIWYSQEARAYALLVLFAALSFFFFVHAYTRPTRTWLAGWALTSALALATHYFAGFLVLTEAVVLLTRHRGRVAVAMLGPAFAAAALAPLAFAQRATGSSTWIAAESLATRVLDLPKQFLVGPNAPLDRPAALLGAGLIAATVVGALARRRGVGGGALLALGVGTVTLGLPVVLAFGGFDYLNPQNELPALVPLVIGFATVAATSRATGASTFLVVAMCALSISLVVAVADDPAFHRTDWRSAAHELERPREPRLIVSAPDFGGLFVRVPLRVYLRELHSADRGSAQDSAQYRELVGSRQDLQADHPVRVREIDVLLVGVRASDIGLAIPGSFRLVEATTGHGYVIRRYRSKVGHAIAARSLIPRRGAVEAAVLLEGTAG